MFGKAKVAGSVVSKFDVNYSNRLRVIRPQSSVIDRFQHHFIDDVWLHQRVAIFFFIEMKWPPTRSVVLTWTISQK